MARSEEMNKATSTAPSHSAGANALCLPWLCACFPYTFAHFPHRPGAARVRKPAATPRDGYSYPGRMGVGPRADLSDLSAAISTYLTTAQVPSRGGNLGSRPYPGQST